MHQVNKKDEADVFKQHKMNLNYWRDVKEPLWCIS